MGLAVDGAGETGTGMAAGARARLACHRSRLFLGGAAARAPFLRLPGAAAVVVEVAVVVTVVVMARADEQVEAAAICSPSASLVRSALGTSTAGRRARAARPLGRSPAAEGTMAAAVDRLVASVRRQPVVVAPAEVGGGAVRAAWQMRLAAAWPAVPPTLVTLS